MTTPTIDPEVAEAITALVGEDPAPPPAPGDWRAIRDSVAALYAVLTADMTLEGVDQRVVTTTSADGAEVALHWFTPAGRTGPSAGAGAGPAVVHAHGGGMVAGEVALFAPYIAEHVAASGVPFLSVEYRRAPEAPGALPGEDVYAGLTWLVEHAAEVGVDPARVAVMGESAGAGLAAAAAIRARDAGLPVARQILVYPMLDDRTVDPDPVLAPVAAWPYSNNATAWEAVLGDARGTPGVAATVAPARLEDHRDLAPAYLEVGALDIFREETVAYARRLWAAGVSAELHVLPGLVHGWDHFAPRSQVHARVLTQRLRVLRSL